MGGSGSGSETLMQIYFDRPDPRLTPNDSQLLEPSGFIFIFHRILASFPSNLQDSFRQCTLAMRVWTIIGHLCTISPEETLLLTGEVSIIKMYCFCRVNYTKVMLPYSLAWHGVVDSNRSAHCLKIFQRQKFDWSIGTGSCDKNIFKDKSSIDR